uniref:Moesin/ezrin/radixin homolog 1 n=1 Tax=Romanomermis culicivorax TaxID=13658 RepID=A0A915KCU6_ROMCU
MWPNNQNNEIVTKNNSSNTVAVRVTTMDAELEFNLDRNNRGRDLFDLVCRTIGLREVWYFGLQFMSAKGNYEWLDINRKVLKQNAKKHENGYHFYLLVKFFPEDVSEELIQDLTQRLFFLQVKQSILNMDIYCPPEATVLLASYAVQAKFGDFDESTYKEGFLMREEEVLPQRVVSQYQMTTEMWEDRIKHWWMNNKGLSREEAEMEYLRTAEELYMYGITYFPIKNKKDSDLWLGVSALGVSTHEKNNKLTPMSSFSWTEINNIFFKDKKFTIRTYDKNASAELAFYSQNLSTNKVILDLCVGNHNLYLRRRQPESLEVQQMKAQAKEDRLRRQADRHKLEKEQSMRIQLEREKEKLLTEVIQLKEQLAASQEALRKCEETADLLAQKAELSAEEALALSRRTSEAEVENQRMRIAALKSEEDKVVMEYKAREAELMAARVIEESEKRKKESDRLKEELIRARQAEKIAKEKLFEVSQNRPTFHNFYSRHINGYEMAVADNQPYGFCPNAYIPAVYGNSSLNFDQHHQQMSNNGLAYSTAPFNDVDIRYLSDEIEKERQEYNQKSKHMQEQLSELKCEIDGLKFEDRQTQLDRIYSEALQQGDNKYATLKRVMLSKVENSVFK